MKTRNLKKPKVRRASFGSSIFGQFMDLKGPRHGNWVVSVLYLERSPTYDELQSLVKSKLFKMTRFKSILSCTRRGSKWVEIAEEEFDWEYHLSVEFEDQVVNEEDLETYIGDLYKRKLDVKKPLWRATLVPNLATGGAALLCCVNHAIADGASTIGVLMSFADDSPIDPTKPLKQQLQQLSTTANAVNEHDSKFVVLKRESKPALSFTTRLSMTLYGIKQGLFGPFIAKHDPPSSLKLKKDKNFDNTFTGEKVLGKSELLDLSEIKSIKSKFVGATVNDVLLALLTMTVKGFLQEIKDPVLERKNPLRASFPVSMRSANEPILKDGNPSNNWEPLAFRFPFDYTTAVDCVWKVKEQVDKHKVSPQLYIQHLNIHFLSKILPRSVLLDVGSKMYEKITATLSNVPAPQKEIHICNGITVTEICFYLFSPLGLYLGIMSYAGKVSLSVNMDVNLKQDPQKLLKHWKRSFLTLKAEVEPFQVVQRKSGS